MIRYDDDLAFVREMFGDDLDDSFIESTVTENIRILSSCQGGHALLRIPGHSGHPIRSNPDTYSI
jgi:hypothetical protein